MPLRNVPINIVGGENQSRSRFFASENTVNLYVSRHKSGRTPAALLPWPGEKVFSSGGATVQRGGWVMNDVLYVVNDQALFSVDQFGVKTSLGVIAGSNRCSFADDGSNLIIRTGSITYVYDGSTLQDVGDADLEEAQSVAFINNQMIYQGIGARFAISDSGDPTSINGLNYATAEYASDDIMQLYTFNEKLYVAGEQTMEVWYNSGTGNPPFDRIRGSTSNVGVASKFSMASTEAYVYFVGNDDAIYRISAYQPEQISPESISKELREKVTKNVIGMACKLDGLSFYIVQLPGEDYTLCYCEQTNEWTRISTGTDLGGHLVNGYHFVYGKHLILSKDSSIIYDWDFNTFTSNGSTILRQRVTSPISGVDLGIPGQRILLNRAAFQLETGEGNTDEPDPRLMVSYSYDGGRSYDKEFWPSMGRLSEARKMVNVNYAATFYDLVIRLRVSDPNFMGFHAANLWVKPAGY